MDIDKDTIRPPQAVRRKRPSALKCIIVLCALIGVFIFGLIVYAIGKGFYHMVDGVKNPHQSLYLNATSNETAIHPFIGKDETFDVYLTVWARKPDAEVNIPSEEETRVLAEDRFGGGWETIRKIIKSPEREILLEPEETVVYAEKVFDKVGRKDRNLHKDISFELPLGRFRDTHIYPADVRLAAVLIPTSRSIHNVKEWTGWKPEGAQSLPRIDDETAAKLGLQEIQREALDAVSVSFGLLELHDKNYMNHTEEEGAHEYFPELGEESDATRKEMMKQWSTYQPHFITKSHVVLVDESRPLNRTAWEKKHNDLRERSCGQNMGLKPSRFMCNRGHFQNFGGWEHRLVVGTEHGDEVTYGPYVGRMRYMAGPRHLLPLPVRRGAAIDKSTNKSSITVHHQFTFSSFTPGRIHLLENFVNPSVTDTMGLNATEAELRQAHNDWEQWFGLLGSRGKDTHPRTRLIIGLLDDVILGPPIVVLEILYWYTRMSSAGIDSTATLIGAGGILMEIVAGAIKAFSAKSVSWELYTFVLFLSGFGLAQGYMMTKLVLPFEIVWRGWIPSGMVRSRWTKRERATRRLERRASWTQRGLLAVGVYAVVYAIFHYDITLIAPLHYHKSEHEDTRLPISVSILIRTFEFTAIILQINLNNHSGTFAGTYALKAYMEVARRIVQLLQFWPWLIGRYEVRGGLGAITFIWIILDVVMSWQACTLPRVEQVVPEDDE